MDYIDTDDMTKYKDNRAKKIKYWRKMYGLNVSYAQYEDVAENFIRIRKVIDIIDLIKSLEIDNKNEVENATN